MEKEIKLGKKNLAYTLRRSPRARLMRLTISNGENLIVTVPLSTNLSFIEKFILEKSHWILDKIKYFKAHPAKFFIRRKKKDYLKYRVQAYNLASERVCYFNQFYGFKINRINIKNQKSRWGSCSRAGNLNFNYNIVFLPKNLADYVITHELCHLGEFNHSKKFWQLLARAIPDHARLRQELKRGLLLK